MNAFLEPVYLNEKMVLNCAAYLFKGVALESEDKKVSSTETKGSLKLGLKFLQDLISPISAEGDFKKVSTEENKSARRYTLGGLHMTVLDELEKSKQIVELKDNIADYSKGSYVKVSAVLKPVDFFTIIEIVKILTPLTSQVLKNFGHKISSAPNKKEIIKDIPKYENMISSILGELESDYLKSKQIAMILEDPNNPKKQIGIVDLDVSDYDPSEVKARLSGGKYLIIGKVIKTVNENNSLSLVQRSFLSTIMDLLDKAMSLNTQQEQIANYQQGIIQMKPYVETLCQLNVPGPAFQVMAMSVCV